MSLTFYLGTHETSWLRYSPFPLFVSHRRLKPRVGLPVARSPWALDSGGFSELTMFGTWKTTEAEYIDSARRYQQGIGLMDWAAPMDWMCEPFMVAHTGLSVERHQHLTVENLLSLRQKAPDVHWIPVLQGWALADYVQCCELYAEAGLSLVDEPVVGVGSVCRRQGTDEIARIFRTLTWAGISCHGFGVKTQGLSRYSRFLTSADSMAWSLDARRAPPLPGCRHKNCANCWKYAQAWRSRLLANQGLTPDPETLQSQDE